MVLRSIAALTGLLWLSTAHAAELDVLPDLPKCSELSYTDSLAIHPDAFKSVRIELAIDEYRGWIKKKIKAFVSLAKRGHARKRKRTSGTMIVHVTPEVSCMLKVKFRAHGDLEDHYPGDLTDEPSLNVNIVDGHIFGITKFILFRPETRNGVDEVFAATLAGQLGFMSPRTSMGTLSIVGKDKPAAQVIFQEKIVKEFLEANHFREGPIIEGDERFAFGHRSRHLKRGVALARLSNSKWALKGPTSMKIAGEALKQMNQLLFRYNKSWATIHGSNMVDLVELSARLGDEDKRLRFVDYPVFEAIIFSMGGTHGFSQDDRRAIYDALSNSFTPIYYDGGTSVLTKPHEKLDRNITKSAQDAVPDALKLLAGLDPAVLQQSLKLRDVDLSMAQIKTAVANMKDRLSFMATTNEVEPVKVEPRTLYGRPGNGLSYIFAPDPSGRLEVCSDSLSDCRWMETTPKLMGKLIAQEWQDRNGVPGIYFGFPRSELEGAFPGFIDRRNSEPRHAALMVPGIDVDMYGDITGKVDVPNMTIIFKRLGASGRAVISNGVLNDWTVRLDDVSGHVKNTDAGEQNFDNLGLTGCLTFLDAEVSGLDLSVQGATCEDGVNFVRVKGEVRRADIRKTSFDAVDADFSDLSFTELLIDEAGNDCLDLSYGNYRGKSLTLTRCGDKGVSVGESSKASFDTVLVRKAVIGLAAKDFGSIKVARGKIENAGKCYDLYNKKQEFSGGYLEIGPGELDCSGTGGSVGPTSLLRGSGQF